jgi:hypothetical protein
MGLGTIPLIATNLRGMILYPIRTAAAVVTRRDAYSAPCGRASEAKKIRLNESEWRELADFTVE